MTTVRFPRLPLSLASALAVVIFLVACDGSDTTSPGDGCTLAIAVSPASAQLQVGETTSLSASVSAEGDCSGPTTAWTSGNANVASVTGGGAVVGLAPGTTVITATVTDASGASASDDAALTVTAPCALTFSVDPSAVSLLNGEERALSTATSAEGGCEGATTTWSSGDENVARISESGVLRAWGPGVTRVTATRTDASGVSVSDEVTVWVTEQGRPFLSSRFNFEEEGGSGTQFDDPISDVPALIAEGGSNNAVAANGQVTLAGGARDNSDWIGMGGIFDGPGPDLTVEIWATMHSVKHWGRIFFVGKDETNFLTLSWTLGSTPTVDRVEWKDVFTLDGTMAPFQIDREYHIVLTIEADGIDTSVLRWYRDGQLRGSFTADQAYVIQRGNPNHPEVGTTWHMLGRSLIDTDETANASYNEFRVWHGAMTAEEVAASYQRGPNPGG